MQNLLSVKEMATPNRFGGVDYLGFEKLTFVPIQVLLYWVFLLMSIINMFHFTDANIFILPKTRISSFINLCFWMNSTAAWQHFIK